MNDFFIALFTNPSMTRRSRKRCASCQVMNECYNSWSDSKPEQVRNCSIIRACMFRAKYVSKALPILWAILIAFVVLSVFYICYRVEKSRFAATEPQINALMAQFPDFTDREFLENNAKSMTQELRLIKAAGFEALRLKAEENFAIFKLNSGRVWIVRLDYNGKVVSRLVF